MCRTALQLYFTGESFRNLKFLKLQGMKMSHVDIYKWIIPEYFATDYPVHVVDRPTVSLYPCIRMQRQKREIRSPKI